MANQPLPAAVRDVLDERDELKAQLRAACNGRERQRRRAVAAETRAKAAEDREERLLSVLAEIAGLLGEVCERRFVVGTALSAARRVAAQRAAKNGTEARP